MNKNEIIAEIRSVLNMSGGNVTNACIKYDSILQDMHGINYDVEAYADKDIINYINGYSSKDKPFFVRTFFTADVLAIMASSHLVVDVSAGNANQWLGFEKMAYIRDGSSIMMFVNSGFDYSHRFMDWRLGRSEKIEDLDIIVQDRPAPISVSKRADRADNCKIRLFYRNSDNESAAIAAINAVRFIGRYVIAPEFVIEMEGGTYSEEKAKKVYKDLWDLAAFNGVELIVPKNYGGLHGESVTFSDQFITIHNPVLGCVLV